MVQKVKNYSVAVVATMSAGKSSLLNALMGTDLLPSQNEACTATVFKITDHDELNHFIGRYYYNGGWGTVNGVNRLKGEWSDWSEVSRETLIHWNQNGYQEIELRGNVPNIANTPDGIRLCFIDTPGPNNARCEEHREITRQVISGNDFSTLIFVINASVAGVRDEFKLLFALKEQLEKREEKAQIIFALNKIDLLDQERGESLVQTVQSIREYLEKEIGFQEPLVIPVCSGLSASIRKVLASHRRLTVRQLAKLRGKGRSEELRLLPRRKRSRLHYMCKLPLRLQKGISKLLEQFRLLKIEYQKALALNPNFTEIADIPGRAIATPTRQVWVGGRFYTYQELFELEEMTGVPWLEKVIAKRLAALTPEMVATEETPIFLPQWGEEHDEISDDNAVPSDEDEAIPQAKPMADFSSIAREEASPSVVSTLKSPVSNLLSILKKNGKMFTVSLTYNPYLVTTQFVVDGEELPKEHKFYAITSGRLQNWIDNLLPELYDEYRDANLCLEFTGTEYDWEDVISAIKIYNEKSGFHFTASPHLSTVSEDRIKKIIDLYNEGLDSPFAELFDSDEMRAAFKRATDPIFEANVIATMSSGKSTVVNALLGQELMPAKNEACTATLAQITDDDTMAGKGFLVQRFDRQGKPLSEEEKATRELLTKWNEDPQTHLMKMRGDIPTIKQTDAVTLMITDTPGPNNARNADHEKATLEAIQSKPLSMVIYVLNATQLSTNDDDSLLKKVCAEMSKGGRQAHDRFVFIANKIDNFDPEKGESVKSALEHVRQYLRDHGIQNPIIIPASAQLAKMLRLPKESLTRKERGDLNAFVELFTQEKEMNMLEHSRSQLSAACVARLEKRLQQAAENHDENAVAEILSGIPIVEELLNDFLQKHAIPAKLKDAVDSFARVMQQSTIAGAMNEEMAKSKKELQETVEAIRNFTESKEMTAKAQKFRSEVQKLEYTISKDANETIRSLNMESEAVIKEMKTTFAAEKNVEPNVAKHLVADVLQKCQSLEAQVGVALNDAMKKEYYSVMDKLREDYQKFAAEVVGKSFPDGSLETLALATMTLPSAQDMVEDYTTTTTERKSRTVNKGKIKKRTGTERVYRGSVSDSTWWKPWTWGKKRDIYDEVPVYEYVDDIVTEYYNEKKSVINMSGIGDELATKIRAFTTKNVKSFEQHAKENVEKAKKTLLAQMDGIDQKLKDIMEQLQQASVDQAAKKKMIEENEKKVAWFNDFKAKMEAVLAI